ncbi:MAG: cyclic lactone autoinducer peptide [Oscillospiraceae bacterium]|nr:cyclic lactone autoinducer peptide [Oscillospiraceae bacterium]
MKSKLANLKMASGALFAALAFLIAAVSANSTCMWISHQPELPENVKKLRKF